MPRTARAAVGGLCYHVISRGNRRAEVFHDAADYEDFLRLVIKACERLGMRVLALCFMPNHIHLVLWPRRDEDLGRFMHWLLTSHVRRYHRRYGTTGRVWQGRFKAFPIQDDEHLLTVIRYVERNAVRAKLSRSAEDWAWGSASLLAGGRRPAWLTDGPVSRPNNWSEILNAPEDEERLLALRQSVNRGRPFGRRSWVEQAVKRLGLGASMRPVGRPPKAATGSSLPKDVRGPGETVNEACPHYSTGPGRQVGDGNVECPHFLPVVTWGVATGGGRGP